MRKNVVSSLLFALLTSFSVASLAAVESTAPESAVTHAKAVATAPATDRVNLNTADPDTLEKGLVGIGGVKARAIVDYREAHGPFTSVDELLEVKGIGTATLEKNRDRLTLD
ncbi:ComEA family DNA-binding protein [Pseudomonas sp. RIT-PI-AD]|uniref:ComEA family DNA-binding protein n=1 Tax=Pseudomonas sp. RIT-PI-AD TaxID=3035294 RepID=UPI0021D80FD1|nr:ComEA family DNA-binding protein [Pseudomonas sp. RIT-PI-AD]